MTIDLAAGAELAGHRIEAVIGRGGMGVVYLAQHLRLGRKVALKVLVPELSKDESFRERFIRESQLAATLDHPNIIPIYDAGEVRELLYISMRYVEGSDLSVWLHRDRTLSPEDTLSVLGQVASALDAAHGEGLVHRDVKPANILTEDRPDGLHRIFLTDFGVTKSLRREGDSLTRAGQLIGTIDYMAPEQITAQPVDGRTDVYSLGCIVYRCLAGTVPYPRDNEVAVMYAHLQDRPPAISSARPELPVAVDKVVRKAMAKSKDARFPTCSEFIEALRPQLATTATRPPKRFGSRQPTGPAAQPVGAPPATATAMKPRRGRRWTWWSAAALTVVGILIAVISLGPGAGVQSSLTTQGNTSSPPSHPSEGTASPPTPIALTWHSVPSHMAFEGGGDQTINRVIASSVGVLGVGYTTVAGEWNAAVWRGVSDGSNWSLEEIDGGGGPGNQGMASVAEGESGFVAVGSDDASGNFDAAAWTSPDGASWTRVSPESPSTFGGPEDQQMRRVVSGGPGFVAVGYNGDAAEVWTSNGTTWTKLNNDAFFEPGHVEEMWSVYPLGPTLVAVGSDEFNGDIDAAVWISTNKGLNWYRVSRTYLEKPGDQQMTTVIAGGPGLVAVGYDSQSSDKDAAVWTSTDGKRWTQVRDVDSLGGPGEQVMKGVTTVDRNLVAVGWDRSGDSIDGAVWTSLDGKSWTKFTPPALGGPNVQQIKSVAALGERLIAVGRDRSANRDEDAAVWVADVSQI